VVLNEVFDGVCLFVPIMSGRATSMRLENGDSRSSFFEIAYTNTKSIPIVLIEKDIALLIRLDGFICLSIIKNVPLNYIAGNFH
jgi:hypothetical protein